MAAPAAAAGFECSSLAGECLVDAAGHNTTDEEPVDDTAAAVAKASLPSFHQRHRHLLMHRPEAEAAERRLAEEAGTAAEYWLALPLQY